MATNGRQTRTSVGGAFVARNVKWFSECRLSSKSKFKIPSDQTVGNTVGHMLQWKSLLAVLRSSLRFSPKHFHATSKNGARANATQSQNNRNSKRAT